MQDRTRSDPLNREYSRSGALVAAICISVLYGLTITGYGLVVGLDYTRMSEPGNTVPFLVAPLAIGTILLVAAVSWLGWWTPVLNEEHRVGPRWPAWVVGVAMAVFIALNVLTTEWGAIAGFHLMMLILAGILVGFNEEVLYRGINVIGLRRHGFGETVVWLGSSVLFAMAHLPNGLFGTGLGGAVAQAVLVFFAASAYYLLRRTSGSLLLPMVFHGLWDFSLFAQEASGAPSAQLVLFPLSLLIGLVATALVPVVIRSGRKDLAAQGATE